MELGTLIHEAKKGNRAAEEGLFHHLSDKFLSFCIRYVKSEPVGQEIMSDGFFKFFRCLHGFKYKSDEELYGYIRTIMLHECLSFLRRKKGFNIVSEPLETDAVLNEDMLDKISEAEIHAMIRKLPVGARTIFNLNVMEGLRHEEIARLLGITASGSRAQLSRAKCLLQQAITFLKQDDENQGSK